MSLGYSRGLSSKMAQNLERGFTLEKLERYCIDFNCTPNDLFDYHPDSRNKLPDNHPLYQLKREDKDDEIIALLHNLPLNKIRELSQQIKDEKKDNKET